MPSFNAPLERNTPLTPELSSLTEQVVLILVGLVGSGKSTFAQALENHFPRFRRCNQDDLGDRRRVEQLTRQSLRQGFSVCVDRTNFNALQRSYWTGIAREFPGTSIWVIVFDTPYEVCAARLRERTSHPTIKSPEQGLSVLSRFASEFQRPGAHEGYDRIISLRPSDHTSPIYSHSDIVAILQRLRDSSPVIPSGFHRSTSDSTKGLDSIRGIHSRGGVGPNYVRVDRGRSQAFPGSTNSPHSRGSPFGHGSASGVVGPMRGHNESGHASGTGSGWHDPLRTAENKPQPDSTSSP